MARAHGSGSWLMARRRTESDAEHLEIRAHSAELAEVLQVANYCMLKTQKIEAIHAFKPRLCKNYLHVDS